MESELMRDECTFDRAAATRVTGLGLIARILLLLGSDRLSRP